MAFGSYISYTRLMSVEADFYCSVMIWILTDLFSDFQVRRVLTQAMICISGAKTKMTMFDPAVRLRRRHPWQVLQSPFG